MSRIVLTPFLLLSGLGLFLCILILLAALVNFPIAYYNSLFLLAVGVFVVWLPTAPVATKLTKDFKQKDLWKAVMRGRPKWLKQILYN